MRVSSPSKASLTTFCNNQYQKQDRERKVHVTKRRVPIFAIWCMPDGQTNHSLSTHSELNGGMLHRGADKSLARPGSKQATATEDFDFHISYL
jgi:hypothetical protein